MNLTQKKLNYYIKQAEEHGACETAIEELKSLTPIEVLKHKGLSRRCYWYCQEVEDVKEVWGLIADDYWKYRYCLCIKDRKELWSTIEDDQYKCLYCRDVKDRKELWSTIEDDEWKELYRVNVKDRKELR